MRKKDQHHHIDSDLIHLGRYRDAHGRGGAVNPPVQHQSTVLFDNYADFKNPPDEHFKYGRYGADCHRALEQVMCRLEQGSNCVLLPSGMGAVAFTFLAIVNAGNHILVVDHCYEPVRHFCDGFLSRMNIAVEYISPFIERDELLAKIKDNTSFIWLETPGSQTFDMVDIGMIAQVAREHNIVTALDNTWGAGYYCKPLNHGVDISVQAATKYICGHADVMMGTVVSNDDAISEKINKAHKLTGQAVAPDDCYLMLRGVRTMATRLRQHEESALQIAQFLSNHPKVQHVMHPALNQGDNQRNYHLWQEYCTGSCGLFGLVLDDFYNEDALANFCDNLQLFGMGFSWGGIESLITVTNPKSVRKFGDLWSRDGQYLRLHIGLEDVGDLQDDLLQALERLP